MTHEQMFYTPLSHPSYIDLGAPHMQLMLFVWHSFSAEMRRVLLTQCAQSVVSVAKDNEYAKYFQLCATTCTCYMYMYFISTVFHKQHIMLWPKFVCSIILFV